jgi:hypothetical protein
MTQKRVVTELHRSAEISNKRKAAAMQMHSKRRANASVLHDGLHTQSQSHLKKVTVTASTQSIAAGSRPGSNGPARPASGNAQIGERMGKYFWNGQAWIDQPETDQCPF